MNNSINKVKKGTRNSKLSPMSRESDGNAKKDKNNQFFPYLIEEDTSIDFTRNIEFSPTHEDSSLPKSLKFFSAHKLNLNSKKNSNDNNDNIMEKNFSYQLELRKEFSYNKGSKNFTIPVFEKKSFILTEQNKKNVKLFQVWPSYNRFLFKGRLIFGPKGDDCHFIFVLFLIFGVSLAFSVLVIPYLWTDISPMLPCFIIYLFVSTITFLLLTTFTDPGIIPKKKIFDLFGGVPSPFTENLDSSEENHSKDKKKYHLDKESLGSSRLKKRKKFCHTCEIYRPSRASHCNDCGNCVEVFDHHCPFVNNCIGKRNYRYFLGFLVSLVLLGISEIAGFLLRLIIIFGQGVDNINQSSMVNNSTLVLVVICVISIPTGFVILCLSGLCFYHLYLVVKGKTTKENLKKYQHDDGLLDERKQIVNWCKTDPPLFDSRCILTEEQIEHIKLKWGGESIHKNSTSF